MKWRTALGLNGSRCFVAIAVALAGMGLSSCLLYLAPDPTSHWRNMQWEGYDTAVAVALARSDIDRNDPTLIARDFTVEGYDRTARSADRVELAGHYIAGFSYTPCPLSGAELIGPEKVNCSLSPGADSRSYSDRRCPGGSCVAISVTSETWADPVSRQVILSTLADFDRVCATARTYGPAKEGYVWGLGCDLKDRKKVGLAVEVEPRMTHPCSYDRIKQGDHYAEHWTCHNPGATFVVVN